MTAGPGRRRAEPGSAIERGGELRRVVRGPAAGKVLTDVGGGAAVLGLPRGDERGERGDRPAGVRVGDHAVLPRVRKDRLTQRLEVRPAGLAGKHDFARGVGEIVERAEKARKGGRSALEISGEKRE